MGGYRKEWRLSLSSFLFLCRFFSPYAAPSCRPEVFNVRTPLNPAHNLNTSPRIWRPKPSEWNVSTTYNINSQGRQTHEGRWGQGSRSRRFRWEDWGSRPKTWMLILFYFGARVIDFLIGIRDAVRALPNRQVRFRCPIVSSPWWLPPCSCVVPFSLFVLNRATVIEQP